MNDYSYLTEAGDVNPDIRDAIISVIGSRQVDAANDIDIEITSIDEDVIVPARRAGIELLISVGTRLRNQNVYNFFAVVLSLLALSSGVSSSFWQLLCMMGVLFSHSWTVRLAKEIGDEVALRRPDGLSSTIGFGVSDNKSYFVKTAHVHATAVGADNEQASRVNGKFLHTVNSLQVPLVLGEIDVEIEKG